MFGETIYRLCGHVWAHRYKPTRAGCHIAVTNVSQMKGNDGDDYALDRSHV